MNFLKANLTEHGYSIVYSNSDQLQLLYYLLDDIKSNNKTVIEWLENSNPDFWGIVYNYTEIEREKDTTIISGIYDDDPQERQIILHRLDLANIIKQWADLYRKKPQEIIISCENGRFKIESND